MNIEEMLAIKLGRTAGQFKFLIGSSIGLGVLPQWLQMYDGRSGTDAVEVLSPAAQDGGHSPYLADFRHSLLSASSLMLHINKREGIRSRFQQVSEPCTHTFSPEHGKQRRQYPRIGI